MPYLKGAAAQLPSPVPAPRRPPWQLAADRRTTAWGGQGEARVGIALDCNKGILHDGDGFN